MRYLKLEIPAPLSGRILVLDELKGLAILLVVLYHAGGVLSWENRLHGDLGVDMFVILSGAGLALGSGYRNFGDFLRKRLLRIYPLYWLALTIFLVAGHYLIHRDYTSKDILLHYLGIHGWFGDTFILSINDSFWFITLIVSVYSVHACLQPLEKRVDLVFFIGALFSLAVTFWFFFHGQAASYSHFALRLPGFFLGLLLGILLKNGKLDLPLSFWLAGGFCLLTFVPYTQGVMFHSIPMGASLLALYAFGWKQILPAPVEKITAKIFQFLGVISLEIFLLHQPLIREYNVYFAARWFNVPPTPVSLFVGMVVAFAATLLLSVELHRLQRKVFSPRRASLPS